MISDFLGFRLQLIGSTKKPDERGPDWTFLTVSTVFDCIPNMVS